MKDKEKVEELLASMAREQVRFNQIKTFFDKPRTGFTHQDYREVQIQMLESMDTLSKFRSEYEKVIGLLV